MNQREFKNRIAAGVCTLLLITCSSLAAQNQPILGEETVRISDHVWAIMGFPNIAIIVGDRATLVVDTGLGPRNGATVAKVAAKLSKGQKLFLTTTHFHPEHAGGEPGFPSGTILIRNAVQQQESDARNTELFDFFRGLSPLNKELLADVTLRQPDVVFENESKLDLGGVTARLMWLGGAHTKGDELIFVEPDRTLISGDVVQNKVVPGMFGEGGTPSSWLGVLDRLVPLNVLHVLPDHSEPGDGSLIVKERAFISDLRESALALKRQGVSAEEAGKRLIDDFTKKYPDWPNLRGIAGFVPRIYAEAQ